MVKKFVFILGLFYGTADAHILHVGEKTFQLDAVKRTSPALCVGIGDDVFYGTLYPGDAPAETLHVQRGTSEYWLGQNCEAGKYSENGVSNCTDCTIGHYCPGGAFHTACTYGAMSCNTKNNITDQAMPAGAPVNQFLTLDQVNEFIPVTDFSQWKQLSCCTNQYNATSNIPSTLNDATKACATGTIGPGTYMFLAHYTYLNLPETSVNTITGDTHSISNAFIITFDHPVSYASMHGTNIFQHFIDTNHENYTEWTISTAPINGWVRNVNYTNVSNLVNAITYERILCVFELK